METEAMLFITFLFLKYQKFKINQKFLLYILFGKIFPK